MQEMPTRTKPFDAAEYIYSDDEARIYLEEVMKDGDAAEIADAIGVVARARGMTAIAKESGMSRESLYRALSPFGNPELATVMKVLEAMGLKLSVEPKRPDAA